MVDFLIKVFIKNSDNIKEAKVREKHGLLAAILGIFSNLFLVLIKVAIGLFSNSLSIVADGFNNLSDMVSSVVSLVSFKLAGKPADRNHPFGHGRMEYVAALLVSFFVVVVGYEIIKQAIDSIIDPRELSFSPVIVVILVISMVIKLWQMLMYKKVGGKIASDTLLATAIDSRNDVLVTAGTLVGILIFYFFKVNVDGIISLLIGLFILYSGIGLGREVISTLIGRSLDREEADRIKAEVLKFKGILGVHDIISHTYGPSYSMVSLHAEVSDKVPISVSHELVDKIEYEVGKLLGILLVIHMDPVTVDDPRLNQLKERVTSFLEAKDVDFSGHDFRLVDGRESINFIFDLEVPHSFDEVEKDLIEKELKDLIKSIDARYNLVVNIEYSFIE